MDDGYSGTSTSRPAFQRLIEDAQDGKVKTIIVKDFSRFARDYIEAGDYMERIFPLLGVRFISVNDGYDSGIQIRNDVCGLEVAIKNIINASYSRDLSAKIAAADHVMQKKGMYLGGYRPFGFLPDPNDCHKLILDPVASQYVRLIFELALQGNRTGTIAKILNEKQIPTPAAYHVAENHVYSEQKAWDLQRSHWTSGTVYHVLKNEKYKGTYVGAKFIMPVPYKHRVLRAPLEQQVRIEDSHMVLLSDYLTVSGTCFINQSSPVITISKNGIRFSKACHTRLDDCEYVELLYHPILQVVILRKSNHDFSTAMHWREDNDVHSAFSARAFSGLVFQTLNWRRNCRYQCRGICRGQGNAKFLIFELDESRILTGKNQYEQAEECSINLKCRLYRSKWLQSITVSDVMESGQVVENPMIGAIPSRNEVQRELDDLLMSM